MDAHGNNHRAAGTPAGGQFATKQNSAPAGSLPDIPPTRTVPADQLEEGQLIVIGAGTTTRYEAGRRIVLDGRSTATVVNVEPFGRRTRVIFDRQDGSRDAAYTEAGETFEVSDEAFAQREIAG